MLRQQRVKGKDKEEEIDPSSPVQYETITRSVGATNSSETSSVSIKEGTPRRITAKTTWILVEIFLLSMRPRAITSRPRSPDAWSAFR